MLARLGVAVAALVLVAAPAQGLERHPRGYIAVGDSITAGVGTSDWVRHPDGTWEHVASGYSYAEQAGVRAFARGGACASDECGANGVRQWLGPMLDGLQNPQTVVVELGVNDLVLGVSADHLINQLQSLRRWLRDRGHRVAFGTIVPPPRGSAAWAPIQGRRLVVNDWIRTQPLYVDYARSVQCEQWLCPWLTNIGDVHVNDAGAARMAAELRRWIAQDD